MKLPRFLKSLTFMTFSTTLFWSASSNAQTQIINLSTGWNNGMVGTGISDDTWKVTLPSGSTVTPKTCTLSAWEETGVNRWVSHNTFGGVALDNTTGGTYVYKATFTISTDRMDCATLVIRGVGADNSITGMTINGYSYPLTLPAGNHFQLTNENVTIILNPANLINGTNVLAISVTNAPTNTASNYAGLNFCGELHINDGNFNIQPVVTGSTTICQDSPLTFGGSLAAGSPASTHYYWRLYECDAAGNITSGGFYWESSWFTGVPTGNYTFPSSLNVTCDKYYMAVLSAVYASTCSNWAQDIHVFNYACKPGAYAGADKTICQGECVNIGTAIGSKDVTYSWSANGIIVGTGVNITVCPQTTTTYTVTATNKTTGCSSTDQVVVTVLPNNPDFDVQTHSYADYYTVTATPLVMNANTVPGFGQYWAVEELDANNNYVFYIQSPTGWLPYPASCNFPGFDDYLLNYSGIVNTLPGSPSSGRFVFNKTYRITRGTWNDNCDWNAVSYLLEKTKSANGEGEIVVTKTKAPAFRPMSQEATTNTWNVSPNPSKGIFNIYCESYDMERTVIEVFDISGKKIESSVIEPGIRTLPLDMSGYTKGVYMLNITTGDVSNMHKIILE